MSVALFPLYAEEYSVKIGVEEGSVVEAIPILSATA